MAREDVDDPVQLRARIAELERENLELQARTNALVAAAQERVYWLDRWQVDLNEVMRRPSADRIRAAARTLRSVYRRVKGWRRRLLG